MEEEYPPGSIWQDDSSLDEEGKVDIYVKVDSSWVYVGKEFQISFFKPFSYKDMCDFHT